MDGLTKALSLISLKAYFSGDGISVRGCFAHLIGTVISVTVLPENIFLIERDINILFQVILTAARSK